MPTRRHVLAGLAAATALPRAGWADVGAPTHLTAAKDPDGAFALYGLRADATLAFRVPLPARGHAAAAHPRVAEAVAFARRPGTFAVVLDCASGAVLHQLVAPKGRHFYGHGAFSADGAHLYTTENEIDTGHGRIGVWSRAQGYARIGEFSSGGIGPHEILRIPGTDCLAIANGGIRTHPDAGREKLNLPTMRPNLTIATGEGAVVAVADVPAEMHQNSLRHIAARADGLIACAFQWQGDIFAAPSSLALYRGGDTLDFLGEARHLGRTMKGYAGSVAFSGSGERVAVTSPRAGLLAVINTTSQDMQTVQQADICGVSPGREGVLATDGAGGVHRVASSHSRMKAHALAFDNHLVRISSG
ncbi:MAG: DUF1513 domain-containing protein [Pseudomonadota bacterium]